MNGNGYYPFPIRQGSKRDFVGAWIMRIIGTVLSGLILSAVLYLVNTLPPMQAKVDKLVTDVASLTVAQAASKQEIQIAAEKARQELIEAEKRVKADFTDQLKKAKMRIAN